MIITVNPVNYPRIFCGFEMIWRQFNEHGPSPEAFQFDNVDEYFNFTGIEYKMDWMSLQTICEFVIDPHTISNEMMNLANLFDADELFDEFCYDELYNRVIKLP